MKYYIIYKIINLINGKFYVGKHITNKLNDSYMGSGLHIHRAINKYGIDSFRKEILFSFNTEKEMNDKEKEIVNIKFVKRRDTYNTICGGQGSWKHINENLDNMGDFVYRRSRAATKGLKKKRQNAIFVKRWSKNISKSLLAAYKSGRRKPTILSKRHYRDVGKLNSERHKGKGNSRYGTAWISNMELKKSKSVNKNLVKQYLKNKWIIGRKFNASQYGNVDESALNHRS